MIYSLPLPLLVDPYLLLIIYIFCYCRAVKYDCKNWIDPTEECLQIRPGIILQQEVKICLIFKLYKHG